jgi:hypothetical protein
MRAAIAPVIAITALLSGCALRHESVPVAGSPADIAAMAGEWTGTYETLEGGDRSGEIMFSLGPGRDTATGYVIMNFITEPRPRTLHGYPAPIHQSDRLSIAFVRASDGRVTGQLEPYIDPNCGCRLRTTFVGRLRRDRIDGTFRSEHLDSGGITTGEWRVRRKQW